MLISVISLSNHMPSFCFYNASLFSNNRKNLFIDTIHVFRNLFWKICPLLKYFFSVESGIYRWQSHQFPFPTLLKAWVKPQRQPLVELFCKKNVLKNFANLFLIELFFNKRDSNTAVSLLNLRNFYKYLFWRTSANNCFWNLFYQTDCTFW